MLHGYKRRTPPPPSLNLNYIYFSVGVFLLSVDGRSVGRTVERKERQPQRERDREERKKERNGQVQQVNEPCYRWETLTHSKLVRVVEERERERCSRTVTLAATLWEEEKCRFSWAQIVGEIVEPREKHVTVSKPERDYYFLPFFLFPS